MHDNDLGKTSLVKHGTRLMDNRPFKECYRCIPPIMYQEVHDHLKDLLEIGTVQPSHSPWAGLVILASHRFTKTADSECAEEIHKHY